MTHLFGDGPAHLFDHQVGRQPGYQTAVTLWLKVADLRWTLLSSKKTSETQGFTNCCIKQSRLKYVFYLNCRNQVLVMTLLFAWNHLAVVWSADLFRDFFAPSLGLV